MHVERKEAKKEGAGGLPVESVDRWMEVQLALESMDRRVCHHITCVLVLFREKKVYLSLMSGSLSRKLNSGHFIG
jgi:hypothetical protein